MSAIRALDRAVMPGPMLTMEERLGEQMNAQRTGAFVLGSLGIIAALLTILGVYVLAESMATLRMREMGIRAALGATRRSLAGLVIAETGQLVGAGVLAGLALAWLGAGTIRSFLYRVEPLDVLTLGIVSIVIVGLAMLVSLRPALRAARVDLAAVLKAE
jgi:ABC-type antimicrobial peptide transport system permease subunit